MHVRERNVSHVAFLDKINSGVLVVDDMALVSTHLLELKHGHVAFRRRNTPL